RSRSAAAIARADASGSSGSSSTVPSGVFEASTPAAADTMPRRFSTMRVVFPVAGFVREATTRTVSAVIASSRSSATTKRPSAFETILLVTTRMSPSSSPRGEAATASPMTAGRSVPEAISPIPSSAQAASTSAREADLGELLAEERLGALRAVDHEAALLVEGGAAGVVLGDPAVERLALVDDRVEELAADALAVPRVEQEDEVELARRGRVVIARGA